MMATISSSNTSLILDGLTLDVRDWDVDDVSKFLRDNLRPYAQTEEGIADKMKEIELMKDAQVSGVDLLNFSEEDLRRTGIRLMGRVLTFLRVIKQLKEATRRERGDSTDVDEGPRAKRQKLMGGDSMLQAFYEKYWGQPLDASLATLPVYADPGEDEVYDDLLPGDPFVDAPWEKFLVRAEYIRIFDMVNEMFSKPGNRHMAVVTGQPGIGKKTWIDYAIRRCFGQRQQVIWYLGDTFYYFSDDGAEVIQPNLLEFPYPSRTWCFADSAHCDGRPLPARIYDHFSRLSPIYVTTPDPENWRKLHQLRMPKLFVMNPWTLAELHKAAVLFPERTLEEITARYTAAGPSARLCLQFDDNRLKKFYNEQRVALRFPTPQRLITVLVDERSGFLRTGDISEIFCQVTSYSEKLDYDYTVGPMSALARRKFLNEMWPWTKEQRVDIIKTFRFQPHAGGIRGLLFESLFQDRFGEYIRLAANPMIRSGSRWHSPFGNFSASPKLLEAEAKALDDEESPPISLTISPKRSQAYGDNESLDIEEDVYYVPLSENEVAVDSFIMHAGNLYLFQFASGHGAPVPIGRLNALAHFSGLPAAENQDFIFVVPRHVDGFSCPHIMDGFSGDHVPYVGRIDWEV